MAIAERLALLRRLRNDLADELTALGLPSRREETLEALVPRVLLALEGTGEGFAAALKDVWDVPGGFFSAGESASLAGMADISRAVRVTALTVTAAGEGAGALTAAGAGWSVSRTGGALTARYSPGRRDPSRLPSGGAGAPCPDGRRSHPGNGLRDPQRSGGVRSGLSRRRRGEPDLRLRRHLAAAGSDPAHLGGPGGTDLGRGGASFQAVGGAP